MINDRSSRSVTKLVKQTTASTDNEIGFGRLNPAAAGITLELFFFLSRAGHRRLIVQPKSTE